MDLKRGPDFTSHKGDQFAICLYVSLKYRHPTGAYISFLISAYTEVYDSWRDKGNEPLELKTKALH